MNKLLTIVVPVYNTEQYIRRCLDSLLIKDNLELLDVLVISDGSPDKSSEIIKEYTTQYPEVFSLIEKENGGHGSVINRGIQEARGKYFRVLDSDDWFDNDAFNLFIEQLKSADSSLVITNSIIEHAYNNTQIKEDYHNKLQYNLEYQVSQFDFNTLEGCDVVTLASATFKTTILRESGIKLYEKCYYEDLQYDLFFLKGINDFVLFDLYVYHYFIGRPEQSVSPQSALNHYEDRLRIVISLADYLSGLLSSDNYKNGKTWLQNTFIRHILIHYKFMLNMGQNDSVKKAKELNRIISEKYPKVKRSICKESIYVSFVNKIPYITVLIARLIRKFK